MNIKMLITDLDGTLLNSREAVSKASIEAFTKLRTHRILPVVATGRVEIEARYAYEAIGATDYFIGMNGAQTINLATGEMICEVLLSETATIAVFQALLDVGLFFELYADNQVFCLPEIFARRFTAGINPEYLERFGDKIVVKSDLSAYFKKTNKFFFIIPGIAEEVALRQQLAHLDEVSFVYTAGQYAEIIPRSIDKGVAVKKLCRYLGIELTEVMAIGDSPNDEEMLRIVGISIAMGNAHERIKALADYIVPTNDEEGVVYALNRFLLPSF